MSTCIFKYLNNPGLFGTRSLIKALCMNSAASYMVHMWAPNKLSFYSSPELRTVSSLSLCKALSLLFFNHVKSDSTVASSPQTNQLQQEAMFVHDPHHYISAPAKPSTPTQRLESTSPPLSPLPSPPPHPQTKPGVNFIPKTQSNTGFSPTFTSLHLNLSFGGLAVVLFPWNIFFKSASDILHLQYHMCFAHHLGRWLLLDECNKDIPMIGFDRFFSWVNQSSNIILLLSTRKYCVLLKLLKGTLLKEEDSFCFVSHTVQNLTVHDPRMVIQVKSSYLWCRCQRWLHQDFARDLTL